MHYYYFYSNFNNNNNISNYNNTESEFLLTVIARTLVVMSSLRAVGRVQALPVPSNLGQSYYSCTTYLIMLVRLFALSKPKPDKAGPAEAVEYKFCCPTKLSCSHSVMR